jgi:hypothetical protein
LTDGGFSTAVNLRAKQEFACIIFSSQMLHIYRSYPKEKYAKYAKMVSPGHKVYYPGPLLF